VLGASGFIGSHVAAALEAETRWTVERHSSKSCNLLDGVEVTRMLAADSRATVIVYATGINRAAGDTFANFEANLRMVHALAMAVRAAKHVTSVIFLSSVDIFGFPADGILIDEDTPVAPATYYGLGKVAAERILRWELPDTVALAILRLPGVFGPDDRGGSLPGRFATSIAAGTPIALAGDGEIRRDLLPVRVVADVVTQLVRQPEDVTVNVVTGRSRSLADWVNLIARALGREPNVVLRSERGVRDRDLVFSATRGREKFPALAAIDVEAECERYVRGRHDPNTR
jgi:nucleoside-diphosphate-sugar epimerase